jgi:hypothetical protein
MQGFRGPTPLQPAPYSTTRPQRQGSLLPTARAPAPSLTRPPIPSSYWLISVLAEAIEPMHFLTRPGLARGGRDQVSSFRFTLPVVAKGAGNSRRLVRVNLLQKV